MILDKFTGVRKGAMLFCGLVALGQLIFSLGVQWKIYYLALFGRFVFGLGGENLTVAQNTFTVRWFDGKSLALAFGLVVAFSRIGTSVNFVVSPILASSPITFYQHQYGAGSCDTELSNYVPFTGEVNECSNGRLTQCEEYVSALPTALIVFPQTDKTCATNGTIIEFTSSHCFALPAPFNATHPSAAIELDPDTNQYKFTAFTEAGCNGQFEGLYGQGNGCYDGNLAGMSFRIDSAITAPCYVATFEDEQCLGKELNRYGMERDVCVVPMNPLLAPYKYTINPGDGTPLTVWIGMLMCGVSFVACMLASSSDYWGEKKVEEDRQVLMSTLSSEEAAYVRKLDEMNEPTSDDISFKMIRDIPGMAWLLFIITAVFYVAILNFYQVASDMMQHTGHHISAKTAGLYMAIPNFVAIAGSPLGGFTVDKMGRALVLITIACFMLICAHVYFLALAYGWMSASPIPVMIWLGVTYSLGASCLWPILAFIVSKEALGTAYGCMTSVQNLFLALASVIIGQLQDWAKKSRPGDVLEYTLPIMVFIGCATMALLLTILLIIVDRRNGGKLNASAAERSARALREQQEEEERHNDLPTNGQKVTSPLAIGENMNSDEAEVVSSSPSKSLNPPTQQ